MPPQSSKSIEQLLGFITEMKNILDNVIQKDEFGVFGLEFLRKTKELEEKLTKLTENSAKQTKEDVDELYRQLESIGESLVTGSKETQSTKNAIADVKKAIDSLGEKIEEVREEIPIIPTIPDYTNRFSDIEDKLKDVPKKLRQEILDILKKENDLLDDRLKKIDDKIVEARSVRAIPAPSRGMFLYIDGVKKGIISNLNLKGGTNMAIAYSKVNGQDTLTFNASGGGPGGITVETPTGTVNAVNTVFTVSAEPQWVVADGITYYDGAGYTYAALQITMDVPPSASIRVII